jgi:hypothetical protein
VFTDVSGVDGTVSIDGGGFMLPKRIAMRTVFPLRRTFVRVFTSGAEALANHANHAHGIRPERLPS